MAGKLQWLGITLLASVVGLLSGTLSAYQLLKMLMRGGLFNPPLTFCRVVDDC